ncbi:MAG: Na+/H+ antiporter NhaC [Firmicutes bacterium]|nr:Na+/H+ antiporter NhaC [Bacillota bacterium]
MSKEKALVPEKKASFGQAILMFLICVIILSGCIIGLGQDVQIPLMLCCGALLIFGLAALKIPFTELRDSMVESVKTAIEVMLIILLIGGTVGTWVACGTVPEIIVLGLKIFSPTMFLPSILIICCIMSMVTGSSWTTMGTIGVAFMGVGLGLGVNPAMTAGCVACGAFFGDKMSPMSDSTNYAAAVAETDLYKHVKSMFFTTGPATLVSLIIFFIIGRGQAGADEGTIQAVIDGLSGAYNLNIALLIPLIVMIVLIILKVPALPCIGLCALLGAVFGMIFQHHSLAQALTFLMSGHVGNTGLPDIDRIITRGGMSSMYGTIGIMLWSLSMAGLFMRTGMVDAIMEKLKGLTKTRVGLIMTHLVTGYVLSFVAADPYLAMIIPARAFGPKYDEMGIDRCVTSRTCEDSGTLVCPMVPWGTSGVYTAATLGVATTSYLPFYTLGYINPIFVLICAITGFGFFKAEKKAE